MIPTKTAHFTFHYIRSFDDWYSRRVEAGTMRRCNFICHAIHYAYVLWIKLFQDAIPDISEEARKLTLVKPEKLAEAYKDIESGNTFELSEIEEEFPGIDTRSFREVLSRQAV